MNYLDSDDEGFYSNFSRTKSRSNVMNEWWNGEITEKLLACVTADASDTISCAAVCNVKYLCHKLTQTQSVNYALKCLESS